MIETNSGSIIEGVAFPNNPLKYTSNGYIKSFDLIIDDSSQELSELNLRDKP